MEGNGTSHDRAAVAPGKVANTRSELLRTRNGLYA
jgi:hypothetical protein